MSEATQASDSALSEVSSYWTENNVTNHQTYNSPQESYDLFQWRNGQYPGIDQLIPHVGYDGLTVLDYGCGPGYDVLGLALHSKAKKIIGVDVSRTSLAEARARIELHGARNVEFRLIRDDSPALPLENDSIDYVISSGVLHHIVDLPPVLRELHRVLRPGGRMRIMLYNYDSICLHLCIAYDRQLINGTFADLPLHEAFRKSTDGSLCPVSRCYKAREVVHLGRRAGFDVTYLNSAIAAFEMEALPKRFAAIQSLVLEQEHREFLANLTFDERGFPYHEGKIAGIDAVFELVKR